MYIINQTPSSIFSDLVEEISKKFPGVLFLTGSDERNKAKDVSIKQLRSYRKETLFIRVYSWLIFTIQIFFMLLFHKRGPVIVASNPPFTFFCVWIINLVKGSPYALIILDIYPDVIHETGMVQKDTILIRVWEALNRKILNKAEIIFTISEGLADKVKKYTDNPNLVVIRDWTNKSIKPMKRSDNTLVSKLGISGKTVIMYSGNIGVTHDLTFLIKVAKDVSLCKDVVFIIIGSGPYYEKLRELARQQFVENILFLPPQDDNNFPKYLALADFGVVTLVGNAHNSSVPSKIYSYLGVGAAIIAVVDKPSEIDKIITENGCGLSYSRDRIEELTSKIKEVIQRPEEINNMKENALKASREKYSGDICIPAYLKELEKYGMLQTPK